jgi:hypothetical protein
VSKELTTSGRPVAVPRLGPEARLVLDVALGAAGVTVGAAVVVVRTVHQVTAPVTRLLWHPPLVPARFHPATVVADLARNGSVDREELGRQVEALLDVWAPAIIAMVVERLDLTRLVEDNVDLDQIVSTVDLDAAVALVDLDAAVERVDVAAVVRRVDLDAIVATVDLDAAVARVDLDAVIDRIDVIGIVEEVLDVIDLPAIIRDSTGSMASETVRGARMTSITADDAISRAVDRALFRRRKASTVNHSDGAPGAGG